MAKRAPLPHAFKKGNMAASRGHKKTRTSPTQFIKRFLFEHKEDYLEILRKTIELAKAGNGEARRDILSFMPRAAWDVNDKWEEQVELTEEGEALENFKKELTREQKQVIVNAYREVQRLGEESLEGKDSDEV